MLNASNADKILKTVYLDVIAKQLDTGTSPFFTMVSKGSEDIYGKDVVSPLSFGINGGIGCVSDDADLPAASSATLVTFRAPIVNIFGNIEITDKVLRASQSSAGSFINVLNNEMESLLQAAKFNFARMLFQDGSGTLATLVSGSTAATSSTVLAVNSVKNVIEGMVIDVVKGKAVASAGHKIVYVDRAAKTIKVEGVVSDLTVGNKLTLQGSFNNEIYGLPYLFQTAAENTSIYNNSRAVISYLLPSSKTVNSVTSDGIQELLDDIEERSGGNINLILASYDMRRKYLASLQESRTNIDYMNLDGGFKTMSYNGIPVYADRFVPENTMYFVNTDDYKLQQLGDWNWLEGENGKILRQLEKKAAYGATLVKYANLICVRPIGQAKMTYVKPAA